MQNNMDTKKYFLKLVGACICAQPYPTCPDEPDIKTLYKLASTNAVQGILYLAVKNSNIPFPDEAIKALEKTYMTNLVRDVAQEEERASIRENFSAQDIDFMFLKGSHLKSLYPVPEVRYMVDMDILIHEKDMKKGKEVLLSHGFSQMFDNGKDIIFTKEPCLTIELHKMLFVEDYFMHDYFTSVWEKAEFVGNHEYKMSDNDLYVYTLAHLAEHYLDAGSCFRPVMDLFLMEKTLGEKLDFGYITERFKEIGIDKFAEKVRRLYKCMFADGEYDDDLKIMENYIVLGAPIKNADEVARVARTNKSKPRRFFEAIFPNFKHMKTKYPTLEKAPFLLPFFWIIRFFEFVFSKDTSVRKKQSKISNVDQKGVDIMRDIFEKSGL